MREFDAVIVIGPVGCGKTRNAETIRTVLGGKNIIDMGDVYQSIICYEPENGDILLTNCLPLRIDCLKLTGELELWTYDQLMEELIN